MSNFAYVACEDSGRKLIGQIEATDEAAAIASISETGVFVLEIRESNRTRNGSPKGAPAFMTQGRPSRSEIALFTRRLADLSAAGLPLDRALQVAGEQSDNPAINLATEEAIRDVRTGLPVSEALAKHPEMFPAVFTMTLRAGEASGQFSEVAGRLADLQILEVRRRSQIAASLVYPLILFVSAIGVIAFMMLFIVPRLSKVFEDLGSDLPLATIFLLRASDFLTRFAWLLAIGILGGLFAYRAWSSTEFGALTRDRLLLKAPLVGKVISKAVISRYARVLGTLVYGGVPILESLRIAGAAAGNRTFAASSERVENDVREGRRIADAMRDTGVFSNMLVQMVAVGEETGDLPRMLGRVSESLDFEVDNGMQKLTAIVEPVIVLGMGAFVGFVVLSILLPVYQAQGLVK